MRIVVDTNVFVSALIRPQGRLGGVIGHLARGAFVPVFSAGMLEELVQTLAQPRIARKYGVTVEDVQAVLELLLARGELVNPTRRVAVCRDADDDRLLEAAVAGRANAIVTGDADVLALGEFEGIRIITPAQWMKELEGTDHGKEQP